MDPISQQAAQTNNPLSRAMLKLYAAIYRADRKVGLPREVDADGNKAVKVPRLKTQWVLTLILLICQTGITFTGSLVRVTGSGLGCETWPQCHPGSFAPVAGSAPWIHQIIVFGNRLLTFVLIAAALATSIPLLSDGRPSCSIRLAFIQALGTIAHAVFDAISVRLDLAWFIGAAPFPSSTLLVSLAAILLVEVTEDAHAPVN